MATEGGISHMWENNAMIETARGLAQLEILTEVDNIAGYVDGDFVICDPFTSDEEFDAWRGQQEEGKLPVWIQRSKTRDQFLHASIQINRFMKNAEERGEIKDFMAAIKHFSPKK
jgi:hypothetical protein